MQEVYEQFTNLLALELFMPYFVLKATVFIFANIPPSLAKVQFRKYRLARA